MLALLFAFFFPIPETSANYTYSGYRWQPPEAPLRIDVCEGSGQVVRGIARSSTVAYGTGFTMRGVKTAARVRIRFTFADDHWQPVRVREEDIEGTFTPGSPIMRTHRFGGDFHVHDVYQHAAVLLCSPIAVDFTDGTRWQWSPPPAPYTAPGALGRPNAAATPQPASEPYNPPSAAPLPSDSSSTPLSTPSALPKATPIIDYN